MFLRESLLFFWDTVGCTGALVGTLGAGELAEAIAPPHTTAHSSRVEGLRDLWAGLGGVAEALRVKGQEGWPRPEAPPARAHLHGSLESWRGGCH